MHPSPRPKTTENACFPGVITLTAIAICRAFASARSSSSCCLNSPALATSATEPAFSSDAFGQYHPISIGNVMGLSQQTAFLTDLKPSARHPAHTMVQGFLLIYSLAVWLMDSARHLL